MNRRVLSVLGFLEHLSALGCVVAAFVDPDEAWRWVVLAVILLNGGIVSLHLSLPAEDAHGSLTVDGRRP